MRGANVHALVLLESQVTGYERIHYHSDPPECKSLDHRRFGHDGYHICVDMDRGSWCIDTKPIDTITHDIWAEGLGGDSAWTNKCVCIFDPGSCIEIKALDGEEGAISDFTYGGDEVIAVVGLY